MRSASSGEEPAVHEFCRLAELKTQKTITKWVEELRDEITAVYRNGTTYVVSSVCPHFGGEFDVDACEGVMRCRWHDWRFRIEDGHCLNRHLQTRLRRYDHFEQNGSLMVRAS